MANKNKKTTIFNKNHIMIIKENMQNEVCSVSYRNINNYHYTNNYFKRIENKVKCESPLGFYYYKTEYIHEPNNNSHSTISEFVIKLPTKTYTITYINSYESTCLNDDIRPWLIHPSDKPIPEHFIYDLKRIIDNILDEINGYKISINYYTGDYTSPKDYKWLHDILYENLFGNVNGIRFQTDSEKIIAHGFDLKTSFRKPKEK